MTREELETKANQLAERQAIARETLDTARADRARLRATAELDGIDTTADVQAAARRIDWAESEIEACDYLRQEIARRLEAVIADEEAAALAEAKERVREIAGRRQDAMRKADKAIKALHDALATIAGADTELTLSAPPGRSGYTAASTLDYRRKIAEVVAYRLSNHLPNILRHPVNAYTKPIADYAAGDPEIWLEIMWPRPQEPEPAIDAEALLAENIPVLEAEPVTEGASEVAA